MKRTPFFCELSNAAVKAIKRRAKVWRVPEWQVVGHAVANSEKAPFEASASYARKMRSPRHGKYRRGVGA